MSSAEVVREPCRTCNGSGVRETRNASLEHGAYQPCPTCRGYGHLVDDGAERDRAVRQTILFVLLVLVILAAFLWLAVT